MPFGSDAENQFGLNRIQTHGLLYLECGSGPFHSSPWPSWVTNHVLFCFFTVEFRVLQIPCYRDDSPIPVCFIHIWLMFKEFNYSFNSIN